MDDQDFTASQKIAPKGSFLVDPAFLASQLSLPPVNAIDPLAVALEHEEQAAPSPGSGQIPDDPSELDDSDAQIMLLDGAVSPIAQDLEDESTVAGHGTENQKSPGIAGQNIEESATRERVEEERIELQRLLGEKLRKEQALAEQRQEKELQEKLTKILDRLAKEGIPAEPDDIARVSPGDKKGNQLHINMNQRELDKYIVEYKKAANQQAVRDQEAIELEAKKSREDEAIRIVIRNIIGVCFVVLLIFFYFIMSR